MDFIHPNHYFNKNPQYKSEGIKTLKILLTGLSAKQKKALLKGLQDENSIFEENQYLEHAVESTINYFFKKNFDKFVYEPKASLGKRNMDCGIEIDNFKINFEVKCPKISLKREGKLYTQAIGFESPQIAEEKTKEPINRLKKLLSKSSYEEILSNTEVGGAKNKYSDLLSLLKITHSKSIDNEVNILVVSLYSKHNFTEWVNYYWDIIIDPKNKTEFQNVDGIIFTNTINHHVNNLESTSYPWSLEKHLLFFIKNPLKYNKNIEKLETIMKKIFGENILLLQNEMIKFDKNIRNKVLLKEASLILRINHNIVKRPIIYTNEYICENIDLLKREVFEVYEKNKEKFKKSGVTDFYKMLNKAIWNIRTNTNMIDERIERLFLCSKLIDKIEEKEGKKFFNNEKYMYMKER